LKFKYQNRGKPRIQNIEIINHKIALQSIMKSPYNHQPSVADTTFFAVDINHVKYNPKLKGIARRNGQNL
jgi:hypothetical protein